MKPILVLLFASLVAAQEPTMLTGLVVDGSGAAVPQAKVTLTQDQQTHKVKPDAEGRFQFNGLAAGSYLLRVEAKGLSAVERKVKLPWAGKELRVELAVAGASEKVTVEASSSKVAEQAIDPERNADRLNFDEEQLAALPASGQNPLSVVAAFTSPAAQGAEGMNLTVDGMEAGAGTLPAQSIRRIRVNRNPYALQFRRPGKARVEVYTEEPSQSRYRGTFGFTARDSVFDARNAFAATRPDLRRTQADLSVGGPLVAKRTTFFLTGERYRSAETAVVNALTLNGPLTANVIQPESRTRLLGRLEDRSELHSILLLYSFVEESEANRGAGGLKLPEQGIPSSVQTQRLQFSDRMLVAGKLVNDLRVVFQREHSARGSEAFGPALLVHGAFTGGPAQTYRDRQETSFRIQNIASYTAGRHNLKAGVEVRPAFYHSLERSNFGGTYEFASLETFARSTPILYRVNRGNPVADQGQHEMFGFIQDETRLAKNLMATYGFRYSRQSDVEGGAVAPRVGLAWSPGGGWVVRGGAGIFHERVTEDVRRRTLLWDGARLVETLALQPAYPAANSLTSLPSVVRSGDLQLPSLTQASVSVEHDVWKRTVGSLEYQYLRGVHLLRSRNINAPVIADPAFLNINQVETSASLRSHAVSATLRGSIQKWLTGMAQYTFSRTFDDTSGPFEFPASAMDLRPEWGRSDYDQRHRFTAAATADLPHGIRLGTLLSLASGAPFDITTGRDDNGDSRVTDRPAGFTRNTGQGPGRATLDLRASKLLRVPRLLDRGRKHTSRNLELNLDAFNLLNRVNYTGMVGVVSSRYFGRPSAALAPRTLQLSLRYRF